MANTGNTQQIIDYGTTANDGTGDPLRTAFIKTDENFNNIWLAGPVGSNITIANNTIQNDSTNGNIILKPNGVGVIQANAAIVPSAANVRDIGTANVPFRAGYFGVGGLGVNGAITTIDLTATGDATVGGNLTVEGDVIQIGNIITDAKTIQLANTAATDAAADGSGVTVGANDDIATLLYNSTNNEWRTNISANVAGNVTANYFVGNGSLLTGIVSTYGNANVAAFLPTYTGNISSGNISTNGDVAAASVLTAGGVYGQFGAFTGLNGRGVDALVAGVSGGTFLGTDVIIQITGNSNAYTQFNFQNINTGTQASTDYVITADDGNDTTNFLNIGLTNSNWDGTQDNSLGNLVGAHDGYFYIQDGNLVIGTKEAGNTHIHTWKWDTTGNVTATGNLIPSANLTYSLGNSTNWWSNIWVASNTIYIGGVALGVTGNTLTVAGEPVLSNDSSSSITTTGNITAGNITANTVTATESANLGSLNFYASVVSLNDDQYDSILISPSGESFAYLAVPKNSVANVYNTVLHNDVGNVEIGTDGGNNTWLFDSAGDLSAPGNITASNFLGNISADNVVGTVSAATTAGTVTTAAQANITSVGILTSLSVSGNITTGNILTDGYFYANGDPFVSSNYGNSNVVTLLGSFGSNTISTTGNITAGNVDATTEITVDALSITNSSIAAATQFTLSASNTATGNSSSILMDRNGVGVVVQLQDTGGGPYSWGLYQDNILFPDGSRQYSAYGNANVVANLAALGSNPISTTGNITAANFVGNVSLTGNITGTSANVELVAGSYTWTFDNTGNTAFANGTVSANDVTLTGNISATVNGYNIGYREIPQITLSANTTAALADSSKHFYSTTSGDLSILIPTNANVAFPTGTAFTVVVQAAGNVLVNADTGVTLYMAGSSSAGNRTVGAYGMATVMKVASDTWFINGTGVY